jgi:hypothetical protein
MRARGIREAIQWVRDRLMPAPPPAAVPRPPRYDPMEIVELAVTSLVIDSEHAINLPEGELDPASPIHLIQLYIGPRGSGAEDLYRTFLMTPAGVRQLVAENGFEWGRHVLLVDRVIPQTTYRLVMDFIDAYCRAFTGPLEEAYDRMGELGEWESEGLDCSLSYRGEPHTVARLVELWSPDAELDSFRPQGPYSIRIRVRIGATGGIEAGTECETYEFQLCTIDWLATERDLSRPSLCNNLAFMQDFDLGLLRRKVEEECAEFRGYSASHAIRKMGRYAVRIA